MRKYALGAVGLWLASISIPLALAYTTTPNMGLKSPVTGDVDYPTSITETIAAIDNHDHSSGKGVPLGTSSVPNAALQTNAVTTAKVNDLAITTDKLNAASVTTAKLADASVTHAKMGPRSTTGTSVPAGGVAISDSSGSFVSTSTAAVDVTNLSVTITTLGRPVRLQLVSDGTSTAGSVLGPSTSTSGGTTGSAIFTFVRDATALGIERATIVNGNPHATTPSSLLLPCGVINYVDAGLAAGTYTYKVQAQKNAAASSFQVSNCKLLAYEI